MLIIYCSAHLDSGAVEAQKGMERPAGGSLGQWKSWDLARASAWDPTHTAWAAQPFSPNLGFWLTGPAGPGAMNLVTGQPPGSCLHGLLVARCPFCPGHPLL